jgi:hypothetical protein
MLAHEAQHRIIRRAQPSFHLDFEHHLPEAVGCQHGHHAHQLGRGEIGAEPHEGGIERHQFLLRSGRAADEDPGEAGQAVDFDQNFRKLDIAEGSRERLPRRFEAGILWPRLAAGQPQFVAIDAERAPGRKRCR